MPLYESGEIAFIVDQLDREIIAGKRRTYPVHAAHLLVLIMDNIRGNVIQKSGACLGTSQSKNIHHSPRIVTNNQTSYFLVSNEVFF